MNDTMERLWQYYQQSCFLLSQPLSPATSFAIVTAHNPCGQLLAASQNRLRDRALLRDIERLQVPYRAIIGAAPDLGYMEKSWAVFTCRAQAYQLAAKYHQNAFYYVDSGTLYLLPCLATEQPETSVGAFHQRMRLVAELPEILD